MAAMEYDAESAVFCRRMRSCTVWPMLTVVNTAMDMINTIRAASTKAWPSWRRKLCRRVRVNMGRESSSSYRPQSGFRCMIHLRWKLDCMRMLYVAVSGMKYRLPARLETIGMLPLASIQSTVISSG